jgi:hypothetical protein
MNTTLQTDTSTSAGENSTQERDRERKREAGPLQIFYLKSRCTTTLSSVSYGTQAAFLCCTALALMSPSSPMAIFHANLLGNPPTCLYLWKWRVSEFGLSGKYFIIHAHRPQSHFHFSCRVPGLAGHLPMPSVDSLSPLISVSSSYVYKDSFLASHLI